MYEVEMKKNDLRNGVALGQKLLYNIPSMIEGIMNHGRKRFRYDELPLETCLCIMRIAMLVAWKFNEDALTLISTNASRKQKKPILATIPAKITQSRHGCNPCERLIMSKAHEHLRNLELTGGIRFHSRN